ncbi:hsp70 family protein [Neofusicoccum parvum]|nr:hsp70 family protein [Neofusicoccum parvum]
MSDNRLKFIVGLDYGTTFSGISYVTSNESSIDKVEVINQWPGISDTVSKVPTRIAYAAENKNINIDKWGFAVTSSMESYLWTKLLLDRTATTTELDDPALKDLFGKGMMKLPHDKTAKQVCTDYLNGLYNYLVSTLCKRFGSEIYAVTPVECWITIPAIWSDAAKDATRSAAISAGFGSRPFDKVNLITEPEAAALAALKPHLDSETIDPILPGEDILVCDCGGGTVDITTYTILETTPSLRFQELCVGVGGKCGSTYIDRNFNKWMVQKFGSAYTDLSQKKRGAGSAFMKSFEAQKKAFGSNLLGKADQKYIEVDHINMDAPSSSSYDSDEAVVQLTWHEMKSFFDPVIKDIIRLVSSQMDQAKRYHHHVSRIILVGGFGDSDYLNERMKTWCVQHASASLKLTCPPQCQAAVVRGAALRGLEGLIPEFRQARRHYGFQVSMPFRNGIDPESKGFIDGFSGEKLCRGRVDWVVNKGHHINSTTTATFPLATTSRVGDPVSFSVLTLHCCSRDEAPDYANHFNNEKIGDIVVRFSKADVKNAKKHYNKNKQDWFLEMRHSLQMKMDTEHGTISFQSFCNGRLAGHAIIEYTQVEYGSIVYNH